jgi:GNAT superfamily N-acetyltransferase
MIRCTPWRHAPQALVAPLIAAEARAWLDVLHWDVSEAWQVIEPARLAGQVPGFLVEDDEATIGWTAYLQHRQSLQVMALVSTRRDATQALVDAILASPEAGRTDVAIVCVRDAAVGLSDVLGSRGFQVEAYRYMSLALAGLGAPAPVFPAWQDHDDAAADLCARAYGGASGVRAFAPNGTQAEWREYIGQLRKGPGCGWFAPDLSFVAPGPTPGALDGAIMMTDLGPGTAHLAQVAVDPSARRRGLGRQLVCHALGRAATMFERATLLVSGGNAPAVTLYESMGFEEVATFVVAARRHAEPVGGPL